MFYCPYYFTSFIVKSCAHSLAFVCFFAPNQLSEQSVGTNKEINAQVPTFSIVSDFFNLRILIISRC